MPTLFQDARPPGNNRIFRIREAHRRRNSDVPRGESETPLVVLFRRIGSATRRHVFTIGPDEHGDLYGTVPHPPRDHRVKRVLIVDDDATVLNAFALALPGFRLLLARDPIEALSVADRSDHLDLVITDFLMPSMTGDEIVARVRARHPAVKALIVTGHGDILDDEAPDWWTQEAHLIKPFGATALQRAVTDLIGPPR